MCARSPCWRGPSWPLDAQAPRQAPAVVRRLRLLAVDRRHAAVGRRPVARVRADVAGRGRRAHRPQSRRRARSSSSRAARARSSRPTASSCIFTIVPPTIGRRARTRADSAQRLSRRAQPAAGRRRPRRWQARGGGNRAQLARHHDARRRPGDDDRARRDVPAAGRVVDVARVSQGSRGRRRRPGAAAAAAADEAAADEAAVAARSRRRRRRRRGSRRRRRAAQGAAAAAGEPARLSGAGDADAGKAEGPGNDLIIRNLDDRAGDDDSRSHRVRVGQDRHRWLLYAVSSTDATKDGVFVRTHDRRHRHGAARPARGNYKSLVVRRGRQAGRVPERHGGVRQAGRRRIASITGRPATRPRPSSCRRATRACRRHGRERQLRAAVLRGRRAAVPRRRRRRRRRRADPNAPAPAPLPVDLWSYKDPQIQPMQRCARRRSAIATTARSSTSRTSASCSSRRRICRPSIRASMPTRALGTSDLPYQQEMSWDQSYNDVYLVDLKTGHAQEGARALRRRRRRCRRAASTSCTSTRRQADWFTLRHRRRHAREPDRAAAA